MVLLSAWGRWCNDAYTQFAGYSFLRLFDFRIVHSERIVLVRSVFEHSLSAVNPVKSHGSADAEASSLRKEPTYRLLVVYAAAFQGKVL